MRFVSFRETAVQQLAEHEKGIEGARSQIGPLRQSVEEQLQAMKVCQPPYDLATVAVASMFPRRHLPIVAAMHAPILCSNPRLFVEVMKGPQAYAAHVLRHDMQGAEQRAEVVQQRAERVRKEANPLNHPLVQKYFQK